MVLRPTVVAPAPMGGKPVKVRRKPFLFSIRSSKTFLFWTAAIGLFTSTFVHSILFPLSPFIVHRVMHPEDAESYHKASSLSMGTESTSQETGVLVACYAVGLLMGSPLFGWLGDKIKQRRLPMLLGILASMMANFLFMFSTTYWMLLAARYLQGIANACVWTMSLCLVADNWPTSELGFQMGRLVGFYPLGLVVGLPVGGVLYSKLGPQAPFVASSIIGGVDFFMRLFVVEPGHCPAEWLSTPKDEEEAKSDHHSDTTVVLDTQGSHQNVTAWQLLKHPRLIVSLLLTVMVAIFMSAFEPTLTMRFATEWDFDAAECGLILIAFMVPMVVASAGFGWLCDRYGCKIVGLASLVAIAPMGVVMGLPDHRVSYWLFLPILATVGVLTAGCQAPVFPEIAKVVEQANQYRTSEKDGLAKSYALFNAAYGTGMCLGPILAGFIYGSIGFFWLCCILSAMPFICIPLVYLYTGGSRNLIVMQGSAVK
ncbi:MFS general substrate transporter [Hesseltinella vesiculosa]|uniref:MFS general substrate transporter n=1 Tax=Hesseltinella vesiculosa TaxID=101127 RepID=A0A1X2GPQ2_9FUNG|nr:MFS general substrate transporter [Hesseltinella vesiculosa]